MRARLNVSGMLFMEQPISYIFRDTLYRPRRLRTDSAKDEISSESFSKLLDFLRADIRGILEDIVARSPIANDAGENGN